MTEPLIEKSLKAEFRRLRETETHAAPGYRQPLTGSAPVKPLRSLQPVMQFALLALMLVTVSAVLFDMGRDSSTPESAQIGPGPLDQGERIAAYEMPTDFLLDTPWFDLAATTPDFDFEFLQYDIPEDLSDEI